MKNVICICNMWKGQSYVNANVSVSSIFKNCQFFLKYHFTTWKYITKHITVVLFSILLHHCGNNFNFSSPNVCIKYWKVCFCILFQLWRDVLKSSQSDIHSMTSLGRPQDTNLIMKIRLFFGNFFYISWFQWYIRHWRAKVS